MKSEVLRQAGLSFCGTLLMLALPAAQAADESWSLSVDALADSTGSYSSYVDYNAQAGDSAWISAGAGKGVINSDFEDIDTATAALGITRDVGEHGGIGAYYDYWDDSGGMRSHQVQIPLRFGGETFSISITPGFRALEMEVVSPATQQPAQEDFDDFNLGLSLTYSGIEHWRFYAGATQHNYSPGLDQFSNQNITAELRQLDNLLFIADLLRDGDLAQLQQILNDQQLISLQLFLATNGPQDFARLIGYQARRVDYLTAVQSLTQGLVDDVYIVEISRDFDLSTLSFEHYEGRLVLDNLKTRSETLRFITPLDEDWDLLLQAGVTDTETLEGTTFFGVSFMRYF